MREINISFRELIDYLKEKDIKINELIYCEQRLRKENDTLKEREYLLTEYLRDKGICLAIKRNTVFEVEEDK